MGRRNQLYTRGARVAADGTAEVTFTAPNGVLHVQHVRLSVSSAVKQPTAILYINGREFEGTYAAANDQTDTSFDMQAQDILTCRWAGADVGATATIYVRGVQED